MPPLSLRLILYYDINFCSLLIHSFIPSFFCLSLLYTSSHTWSTAFLCAGVGDAPNTPAWVTAPGLWKEVIFCNLLAGSGV